MSCLGMCSCVSYIECHGSVCAIVSLTLCVKCWSDSLVSYTECQVSVCGLVSLTLSVKVWSCVLVSRTLNAHALCWSFVLVSLTLCVKCWSGPCRVYF